jgi:hypothetical protein
VINVANIHISPGKLSMLSNLNRVSRDRDYQVLRSKTIAIFGSLLFAAQVSNLHARSNDPAICKQFRTLLNAPYKESSRFQRLDARDYPNADIDGDDISDHVDGGCPGDIDTPGDPCLLTYTPSSSKRSVKFSFKYGDSFYLVRYKSKVYAVASGNLRFAPDASRKVYQLRKQSVRLICSNL